MKPRYLATSSSTIGIEIKKSRFVAIGAPVRSEEEATAFIRESCDKSASHNCFAFRLEDVHRFSDDGEPGGTAGRPILSVIEHADLFCVAVLVRRWFGGIKLGTGGLARAYGSAAAECLRQMSRTEWIPMTRIALTIPFDAVGLIYSSLGEFSAARLSEDYTTDGVVLSLELPARRLEEFKKTVSNVTRGAARFIT